MRTCFTLVRSLPFAALLLAPMLAQAQSPRMVLIEEATNASCPPCAAQNPFFEYYLALPHTDKAVIPIAYHANWPGRDVMNAAAPAMHNGRVQYYAISGVPMVTVNGKIPTPTGTWYAGAPADTVAISREVVKAHGEMSPITIDIDETRSGDDVTVDVKVSSTTALSGKMLRIALVEGEHYYASAGNNGETHFPMIVREMFPSYTGVSLDLTAGETKSFQHSYTMSSEWNKDLMYVVAWVQDDATKEVLQAGTDKLKIGVDMTARTSMVTVDNGEPVEFNATVRASDTSMLEVRVEEHLPAGWTAQVQVGGVNVATGAEFAAGTASAIPMKVMINPAPGSLNRKGEVTVHLVGPRGAEASQTVRVYDGDIDVKVLKRDEGRPEIGVNFEKGLDYRGQFTFAVVEPTDEDLFTEVPFKVLMVEVGKWVLTDADVTMIRNHLAGGGKLFLTGAEIGYGIADPTSTDPTISHDKDFLNNVLKADYVSDTGPGTLMKGVATDPVSMGLTFSIADGVQNQDTPDELAPRDGAVPLYLYNAGTNRVAGIRYEDPVNGSRFIFLGFGLEGVGKTNLRSAIMTRGIQWLLGQPSDAPLDPIDGGSGMLAAQPNPASSNAVIPFMLESSAEVKIDLYDIAGSHVRTIASGRYPEGASSATIDCSTLPAGVYTAIMTAAGNRSVQKVTVVR